MSGKKKRGRPSTITLVVEKEQLEMASGQILQVLKTTIRGFAKSGSYIPLSQEYADKEAFVVVMNKNGKKKHERVEA